MPPMNGLTPGPAGSGVLNPRQLFELEQRLNAAGFADPNLLLHQLNTMNSTDMEELRKFTGTKESFFSRSLLI